MQKNKLRLVWKCYQQNVYNLVSRVFANSSGDQGSIPGRVIPKIQKIVLDATLLNTQHFDTDQW